MGSIVNPTARHTPTKSDVDALASAWKVAEDKAKASKKEAERYWKNYQRRGFDEAKGRALADAAHYDEEAANAAFGRLERAKRERAAHKPRGARR